MSLRVELSVTISHKMAIPLVVPAEYGPLPQNNTNRLEYQHQNQLPVQNRRRGQVDRNNNREAQQNQRNLQYGPDLLNGGDEVLEEQQPNHNNMGFFAQLVSELWTVFTREPARRPRLSPPRNRDNQRHGLRRDAGTNAQPLPDVVQCHGLIFDLSIESRRGLSPQLRAQIPAQPNQPFLRYNNQLIPNHTLAQFTHDLDEDEESWSFGIKVSLSPWRETGRSLRNIADQFQFEGSARRRSSSQARSVEFRLILKVALPTIALVGLGVSYIRRHL